MKVETIEKAAEILRNIKEFRSELHYAKDRFAKFQKGGKIPSIEFMFGEDCVNLSQRISNSVAIVAFEKYIDDLEKKIEYLEKELETI